MSRDNLETTGTSQFINHANRFRSIFGDDISDIVKLIPAYDGRVDVNHTDKNVYVNPVYLTTIVAGSAGSKEKLSSGKAPQRTLAKYIQEYG